MPDMEAIPDTTDTRAAALAELLSDLHKRAVGFVHYEFKDDGLETTFHGSEAPKDGEWTFIADALLADPAVVLAAIGADDGRLSGDLPSSTSIDGVRLTWRDLVQYERERKWESDRWRTLVSDLNRCEHGRHEGDVCGGTTGCNGPSHGGPLPAGTVIGYTIDRTPIVVPDRARHNDIDAWAVRGSTEGN